MLACLRPHVCFRNHKRGAVSVSLLSIQANRDVFSHGGCRVFLLDVSHVVERRSSTVREARERNERGSGLSILDPPISFSISFYTFVTSSSFAPLSLSLLSSITSFHVSPQKGTTSYGGRKEVRRLYHRKPTLFCLAYHEVGSRLSANFKCPFIASSFRQDKLLLTGFLPFSRLLPPDTIKSWRTSTIVVSGWCECSTKAARGEFLSTTVPRIQISRASPEEYRYSRWEFLLFPRKAWDILIASG